MGNTLFGVNLARRPQLSRIFAPIAVLGLVLTLFVPNVAQAAGEPEGKITDVSLIVTNDGTSTYHGDSSPNNGIVAPGNLVSSKLSFKGNNLKNAKVILEFPSGFNGNFVNQSLNKLNVSAPESGFTSSMELINPQKVVVTLSTHTGQTGVQNFEFDDIQFRAASVSFNDAFFVPENFLDSDMMINVSVIDEDDLQENLSTTGPLRIEGKMSTTYGFGARSPHTPNSLLKDYDFGTHQADAWQSQIAISSTEIMGASDTAVNRINPQVGFGFKIKLESKPFGTNNNAYQEIDLTDPDVNIDLGYYANYEYEQFQRDTQDPSRYFSPNIVPQSLTFTVEISRFANENLRLTILEPELTDSEKNTTLGNPVSFSVTEPTTFYDVGRNTPVVRRASLTAVLTDAVYGVNALSPAQVAPGGSYGHGARRVLRSDVDVALQMATFHENQEVVFYDILGEDKAYQLEHISLYKNWRLDSSDVLAQLLIDTDFKVYVTTQASVDAETVNTVQSWMPLADFLSSTVDQAEVTAVKIEYISERFPLTGTVLKDNSANINQFPALTYKVGRKSISPELGSLSSVTREPGVKLGGETNSDTATISVPIRYGQFQIFRGTTITQLPNETRLSPFFGGITDPIQFAAGETIRYSETLQYHKPLIPQTQENQPPFLLPPEVYFDYDIELPHYFNSFNFPKDQLIPGQTEFRNKGMEIISVQPRTADTGFVIRVRVSEFAANSNSHLVTNNPMAFEFQSSILYEGRADIVLRPVSNEYLFAGPNVARVTPIMLSPNTTSAFQLYTDQPLIEKQDINELTWMLEWNNFSADSNGLSTFAMKLPSTGDGGGSTFSGDIAFNSLEFITAPGSSPVSFEYLTSPVNEATDLNDTSLLWAVYVDGDDLSSATAIRVVVDDFVTDAGGRGVAKIILNLENGSIGNVIGSRIQSHFAATDRSMESIMPSKITLFGEDETIDPGVDDGLDDAADGAADDSVDGTDDDVADGTDDDVADGTDDDVADGTDDDVADETVDGVADETVDGVADETGDDNSEDNVGDGQTEGETSEGQSDNFDEDFSVDPDDQEQDEGSAVVTDGAGQADENGENSETNSELADSGIGQSQRGSIALAVSLSLFGIMFFFVTSRRRELAERKH